MGAIARDLGQPMIEGSPGFARSPLARRSVALFALSLAVIAPGATGCTVSVDLEGKACPCTAPYVCTDGVCRLGVLDAGSADVAPSDAHLSDAGIVDDAAAPDGGLSCRGAELVGDRDGTMVGMFVIGDGAFAAFATADSVVATDARLESSPVALASPIPEDRGVVSRFVLEERASERATFTFFGISEGWDRMYGGATSPATLFVRAPRTITPTGEHHNGGSAIASRGGRTLVFSYSDYPNYTTACTALDDSGGTVARTRTEPATHPADAAADSVGVVALVRVEAGLSLWRFGDDCVAMPMAGWSGAPESLSLSSDGERAVLALGASGTLTGAVVDASGSLTMPTTIASGRGRFDELALTLDARGREWYAWREAESVFLRARDGGWQSEIIDITTGVTDGPWVASTASETWVGVQRGARIETWRVCSEAP